VPFFPDPFTKAIKSMKDLIGRLFGREEKPRQQAKPAAPVRPDAPRQEAAELHKKGDVIDGRYEVHGTLGKGGFGIVYLVHCRDTRKLCALKTFRDELLADPVARDAFKREAMLWVKLEEHPFILAARWVAVVSGRLFVQMDYVAPDAQGRVSLDDHLTGVRLHTNQVLEWAIQFC
jgi:hypothetical protein